MEFLLGVLIGFCIWCFWVIMIRYSANINGYEEMKYNINKKMFEAVMGYNIDSIDYIENGYIYTTTNKLPNKETPIYAFYLRCKMFANRNGYTIVSYRDLKSRLWVVKIYSKDTYTPPRITYGLTVQQAMFDSTAYITKQLKS